MSVLGPSLPAILSVRARPQWLRPAYATLVLVANQDQLAGLDPAATDTLVWTTDWMAWRRWCDQGGHGLHFEYFLDGWLQDGDRDRLLSGCEWMYADGIDLTLFEGVSLGKQFNWEVVGAHHAFTRLLVALERALERLGVRRIQVRGVRAEYDFLDADAYRRLVEAAAARNGADIVWDLATPPAVEAVYPEMPFNRESTPEPHLRARLRGLYERVVDAVFFAVDRLRPRRPRVLIFNNPLIVRALLGRARGLKIEPVLLAGMQPKSLSFIRRCMADGIRLARLPSARLDGAQRAALAAIRDRIEDYWRRTPPADTAEAAQRLFVRRAVLAGSVLEERAVETLRYGRLMRRLDVVRVLVGDSENQTCRLLLELAARDGRGSDELLNGMFLSYQRIDSRTGDRHRGALLQRLLAWGAGNEAWLAGTNSPVASIRTGYPVVELMRAMPVPPPPGTGNALVLPLHIDRTDVAGLYGEVYAYLVETVRALRAAGYANVRIKVHPGFHDIRYYRTLLDYHRAECEVYKDGPLADHIRWADMVVGPVNSGAFIETMAMRRPYYPMRNLPSSLDPALYAPAQVSDSVAELTSAVTAGNAGDDAVLAALSGWDPSNSAVQRVWRAIEEACC